MRSVLAARGHRGLDGKTEMPDVNQLRGRDDVSGGGAADHPSRAREGASVAHGGATLRQHWEGRTGKDGHAGGDRNAGGETERARGI